ncbi:MAG TPA: hypothetical protein VGR35_00580 [Tepidisphaeraceae bacterium]|nr:hypothetical protein [Tepidisphaeraceae bacterium]
MRYRFRGLVRETGKPVEGHVEAEWHEQALNLLSENGIVTESLREEPKPLNLSATPEGGDHFSSAIDSAVDTSSTQVSFDALADKFKGKSVWVIDRDKIRKRVSQVVDQAITASMQNADTGTETRDRVADAIEKLFQNNENLTSRLGQMQAPAPPPPPQQALAPRPASDPLERQLTRLANFITKAENLLVSMQTTLRNVSVGGGGYAPRRARGPVDKDEQNSVLAEIFKSNVALLKSLEVGGVGETAAPPEDGGGAAPEPVSASAPPDRSQSA